MNAVRYRLHNREGITAIVNALNGLFQNPVRIAQFQKVCTLYNIVCLQSVNLDKISAYLSGLFDSDGSIYLNRTSGQVFITISQKTRYLLDLICSYYGGKVYYSNAQKTAFK